MTILHIDSSINLETSATRVISKSIVDQLKAAGSGERVIYRDLVVNPLPHLTFDSYASARKSPIRRSTRRLAKRRGSQPDQWRAPADSTFSSAVQVGSLR